MTHFVRNFVALFVAINPISVLTFFVALTADCAPALKLKLSVKSVLVAFAVMLFFIVVAEFIIEAMGLSLRSFQVAGGIILFLVAISLVLGTGEIGSPSARTDYDGMAIFPLAVPGICGPATMLTAMVLADDNRFGMLEQLQTALAGAARSRNHTRVAPVCRTDPSGDRYRRGKRNQACHGDALGSLCGETCVLWSCTLARSTRALARTEPLNERAQLDHAGRSRRQAPDAGNRMQPV